MKTFDAFGHVHINDTDTTHIYSDFLRYLTDKRLANFKQHVRLTDGHGVLTTEELEYDVNTKIGIYKNGGKVINKKHSAHQPGRLLLHRSEGRIF